uniref:Uncharacterized protein n=1 Tax=Leersia perrieri TaxID=77586 RepID=A0A0D9WP48_9ORYZ
MGPRPLLDPSPAPRPARSTSSRALGGACAAEAEWCKIVRQDWLARPEGQMMWTSLATSNDNLSILSTKVVA